MGRPRKYGKDVYTKGQRGTVSHDRSKLVGEFFGYVDESGATYIDKKLAGHTTVTYVFKKDL